MLQALERQLRSLWARGQEAWPGLFVEQSIFARHLAERIKEGEDRAAGLAALRIEDLYLVCACLEGAPGAVAIFERRFMAQLPAALARCGASTALAEDVMQSLRASFFAPAPGVPSQLAKYAGRGPLVGWLKRRAAWYVGGLRRKPENRLVLDPGGLVDQLIEGAPDAVGELLDAWHRQDFEAALKEALAALTSEQRTLLRYHYIKRISQTQIAATFGVDKGTISRRMKAALEAVRTDTERILRERLNLTPSAFRSLADLLRSRMDVSIARLLGDG